MYQKPLHDKAYRPHFSGHETFPLRYGWLKKAFDAIVESYELSDNRSVFLNDDAISRFGVGKNMVASMRHWATAVGVLSDEPKKGGIEPCTLGRLIFDGMGQMNPDPFLENPSTLWLIHWQLCSRPKKTTWYWTFNHYPGDFFERSQLCEGLERLAYSQEWTRTSPTTIKRDVECFVRTYATRPPTKKTTPEDNLESPLAELGLIKLVGKRDGFRLVRGAKPTLGQGVFLFALVDFWKNSTYKGLNQLPFEAIFQSPGSPGRVFLLDENDLADRLINIEEISNGTLAWSETSGIRGIIKKPKKYFKDDALFYITPDYK